MNFVVRLYKFIILIILFAVISYSNFKAQSKLPSGFEPFNFQYLSSVQWNVPNGIAYNQVPGANLGAISFEIIKDSLTAYLCNSTNEIVITELSSGNIINKFNVKHAPRDFVYSDNWFWVLTDNSVVQYSFTGIEGKSFPVPPTYYGVERITRYNNSTYLLLPSGNCVPIESNGDPVTAKETEGWITNAGYSVAMHIQKRNLFTLKVITETKEQISSFDFGGDIAGVYVIGAGKECIFLDVEIFISENPVKVKRYIAAIHYDESKLGGIRSVIKVPDNYYVFTNKDFLINSSGHLYNMLTTPEGVFISALNTDSDPNKSTINKVTNEYHFNDHLATVENADEDISFTSSIKQITREQVISNAVPYASFTWTAASCNIWNNIICGSKSVISASWVTVGSNISMPYCWGGWSTTNEHNNAMLNCKSAGDINTNSSYGSTLNCASGHDCSGFVTRAWGLDKKYSTRSLPDISNPVSLTATQPGDILNVANNHVRLITKNYSNGNYQVIEASGLDWKTAYHSYTTGQLTSYTPRKYNGIVEQPTEIKPDSEGEKYFILYQNYPNPFNPITNIKFHLPEVNRGKAIFTQLKIYDILGNEVAELINEEKQTGLYNLEFNGSSLPSGVYFYKLQSGSFTETKKFILIK